MDVQPAHLNRDSFRDFFKGLVALEIMIDLPFGFFPINNIISQLGCRFCHDVLIETITDKYVSLARALLVCILALSSCWLRVRRRLPRNSETFVLLLNRPETLSQIFLDPRASFWRIMIIFAFLTGNSSLEPLLEGLLSQIKMDLSSDFSAGIDPGTCG